MCYEVRVDFTNGGAVEFRVRAESQAEAWAKVTDEYDLAYVTRIEIFKHNQKKKEGTP